MDEVASIRALPVLLSALQLGDSFFPSGRYTLSSGLESFAEAGLLTDVTDLEAVLSDFVVLASRSEAVAAAQATIAAASQNVSTLIDIDQLLLAMRLPAEASAVASVRTGHQVLMTACRSPTTPLSPPTGRRRSPTWRRPATMLSCSA